jgi:hypothetical protein
MELSVPARCRAATELRARDQRAARQRAGPVRAGSEPADQAGGSGWGAAETGPAAMEPYRAVTEPQARGRPAARRRVARAEAGCCCLEQPGPARGERAPLATREQLRAAGLAPSVATPDDAEHRHLTALPAHSAGSPAHPAGRAKTAARSDLEPGVAGRSARPKGRGARLAERAARPGQARGPQAASGGAAARARPGRQEALPAVRTADAGRPGPLRPDVPAQRGEPPAVGPVPYERQGVPVRQVQDAPARRAAGGADQVARHRPTGPGQAGAMERRNCPATA